MTPNSNFMTISLDEFNGLIRCREQRDALVRMLAESESKECTLKARAQALVRIARLAGLVLTIREESLSPLRMGNTQEVVNIRPLFVRGEG